VNSTAVLITAVHQHRTERPHCSLLEFVNRTR